MHVSCVKQNILAGDWVWVVLLAHPCVRTHDVQTGTERSSTTTLKVQQAYMAAALSEAAMEQPSDSTRLYLESSSTEHLFLS